LEEGVRQKFETEKREKIMIWSRGEKVITRTEKGTSSTLHLRIPRLMLNQPKKRDEKKGECQEILCVMRLIDRRRPRRRLPTR